MLHSAGPHLTVSLSCLSFADALKEQMERKSKSIHAVGSNLIIKDYPASSTLLLALGSTFGLLTDNPNALPNSTKSTNPRNVGRFGHLKQSTTAWLGQR
jgi:hypothetical protein